MNNCATPGFVIAMLCVLTLAGCSEPDSEKVTRLGFNSFEPFLQQRNDTVYVINFWATWCKPCIEELPEFEKLNDFYSGKKVKVILVSLDFPNKHEELLIPFLQKHNIRSTVIHLTEVNANNWIDRVDPGWSGAIPATLIYKNQEKDFFERKMNFQELKSIVELKLN
jgi:thiol-disulfide isomerase/thioredoxin